MTSTSSPGSSRFPIWWRQERRRRKREDPGDDVGVALFVRPVIPKRLERMQEKGLQAISRLSRLKKSNLLTLVYRNLNDICICLKLRITKTIVFLRDVIVTSKTRRNVKGLGTWIVTKKHCACSWRSESVFYDPLFLLVVSIVSHPHTPILPCSILVPWEQRFFSGMGFRIYQFVRVASRSRSWLTTRLTSDANNCVNAKTMPEKKPLRTGYVLADIQ